MRFAEVLINRPSKKLDRTFTYRIPETATDISAGWRVLVPFAGGWQEGIVLSVTTEAPSFTVKEIHSGVGREPWFSAEMMALAEMIASYYVCTRLTALRLFMFDSSPIRLQSGWQLTEVGRARYPRLSRLPQLASYWGQHLPDTQQRDEYLEAAAVPTMTLAFPTIVRFGAAPQVTQAMLGKRRRQRELYAFLTKYGTQTAVALSAAGFSSSLRREAEKNGLVVRTEEINAPHVPLVPPLPSLQLTVEQETALQAVQRAQEGEKSEVFLLHGVTGSGKTEVYIRAAESALARGKSVLILVPEIALTPQMTARFSAHFGDTVIYAHSGIAAGARYGNWWRIRHEQARVVVGARSALFLPHRHLGLIVVDEEYDSSYKQEESPRYHARRVAEELGRLHGATVVLGGATPAVTTYYRSEQGDIHRLELTHRIGHLPLPEIVVADMRSELETGNLSIVSRPLQETLQRVLEERKQAILLLNRRGYATYVLCRECGYIALCPRCEHPLTYHLYGRQLRCHHCECNYPVPQVCPECQSRYIKFLGIGTQKAEQLLTRMFPQARIIRLDRDTMGNQEKLSAMLHAFHDGQGDILLGTQLVAKGHDLPNVRAVGILSVDNLLNLPDYTAAERAFSLLTQAAGRAGRKDVQGEVVLQTYHPEHYAVRHARTHDYRGFYEEEIQYRQALRYPPFSELMRMTFFDTLYERALSQAEKYAARLLQMPAVKSGEVEIIGPYDEYVRKVRDRFYVSLLIKGSDLTGCKKYIRSHPDWTENGIIIDTEVV